MAQEGKGFASKCDRQSSISKIHMVTWKKSFLLWTHVPCGTLTHLEKYSNKQTHQLKRYKRSINNYTSEYTIKMSVLRQRCPYTQCDHNSFHLDFVRKELVLRNDTTMEELGTLIGKWQQKAPIAKGPMYKTMPPGTQTGPCTQCTTKVGHRQHDPDSAATAGKGKAPKSKLRRKRDGANHSYSKLQWRQNFQCCWRTQGWQSLRPRQRLRYYFFS